MKPYRESYIDTGDGHQLYCAIYGQQDGKPVVLLHGGPGYGCDIDMLAPFDCSAWNILMFDQRGSGKSLTSNHSVIENNTLQLLSDDITLATRWAGFNSFTIKGESWGTTLALYYSQLYPELVRSLILTGVFLGENRESFFNAKYCVPDIWFQMLEQFKVGENDDPLRELANILVFGTEELQHELAKKLVTLEIYMADYGKNICSAEKECLTYNYPNIARIEYYYYLNDFFLKPNEILNNCWKINNIPTTIIHGRNDWICPAYSAWKLSKQLPSSELFLISSGYHSDLQGEMLAATKLAIIKHQYY